MARIINRIFSFGLIALGIQIAIALFFAAARGDISFFLSVVLACISLGMISGLGLMFMIFNPHQVIQTYYMSFHRLVEPKRVDKSFSERIHVSDEDED